MNSTLFLILFALAVGLATGLIVWVITRSIASVPSEDRQYRDQPPLGFRLIWPVIQWLAHNAGGYIGAKTQHAVLVKLRQAGMDFSLTPLQFIAGRVVSACIVALIAWWGIATFDQPEAGKLGFSGSAYFQTIAICALLGYLYPAIWLGDHLSKRKRELLKAFPFYLDIITLCVEAGLNMQGAMAQAVAKGPKGVVRDEFQKVLRDIRAGKSRAESLQAMAERLNEPAVGNFCTSVIQAESMGMNLGPVLRAQADQQRSERFLRAEKLAMEAPVKMLFPLMVFIFPCTFIVIFFPIVMKFMHAGL